MAIPNISIYSGSTLATLLGFNSRPLGGVSNPIEVSVWNDIPTEVVNESVGTGNGTNADFTLDYGNLYATSTLTVKVDGVTKTESVDYSVNRTSGGITFLAGKIPTAGQGVTASYFYGSGAGTAANVYLLSRRRQTFVSSGSAAFTLAESPTMVYEVTLNSALTENYTLTNNLVVFDTAPAAGAVVTVIYEDESCLLQMLQVKSSGVEDPFTQSPVDDAQTAYVGIGGHTDVVEEAVGTGDDGTAIFTLNHPCVVGGIIEVKVAGSVTTDFTLDSIRGEIEFTTAPASAAAITASYSYYNVRKIGAIPAACGRKIQTRGYAATNATQAIAETSLEVWGV